MLPQLGQKLLFTHSFFFTSTETICCYFSTHSYVDFSSEVFSNDELWDLCTPESPTSDASCKRMRDDKLSSNRPTIEKNAHLLEVDDDVRSGIYFIGHVEPVKLPPSSLTFASPIIQITSIGITVIDRALQEPHLPSVIRDGDVS